jgi:hypothetical protein
MERLGTPPVRALLIGVVVLLLSASAALAFSSGVEGVKSLAVYDADGRLVGDVLQMNGAQPVVAVRVGGTQAFLVVNREGFMHESAANTFPTQLVFESGDCTGPPFATAFSDPTDLIAVVVINGTKLYSPGPISSGQTLDVRSVLHADGLCEQAEFEGLFPPTELLVDLALEFQSPFRLQVK